jgi:hypothetical protein
MILRQFLVHATLPDLDEEIRLQPVGPSRAGRWARWHGGLADSDHCLPPTFTIRSSPRQTLPLQSMPRPLGILILAAAALLVGVYAWFGVVWLLSAGAKLTGAHALDLAMYILAPHMAGWLIALTLGVITFILILWIARRRRISWLGFGAKPTSGAMGDRERRKIADAPRG